MPTKKKRIGFIPRNSVLLLINKLSYESNLSYSKMINILVEEALHKRGMFNIKTGQVINDPSNFTKQKDKGIVNNEFNSRFKSNLLKYENLDINDIHNEPLDNEIYSKFLMFLQFQERMKRNRN